MADHAVQLCIMAGNLLQGKNLPYMRPGGPWGASVRRFEGTANINAYVDYSPRGSSASIASENWGRTFSFSNQFTAFFNPLAVPVNVLKSSGQPPWRSRCLLPLSLQNSNTCLIVCLGWPNVHAGEITVGTRCLKRKSANPIFSDRIWMAKEDTGLKSFSWSFNLLGWSSSCCAAVPGPVCPAWYPAHSLFHCSLKNALRFLTCYVLIFSCSARSSCLAPSFCVQGGCSTLAVSLGVSTSCFAQRYFGVDFASFLRPLLPCNFLLMLAHAFSVNNRVAPFDSRNLALACKLSMCLVIGSTMASASSTLMGVALYAPVTVRRQLFCIMLSLLFIALLCVWVPLGDLQMEEP